MRIGSHEYANEADDDDDDNDDDDVPKPAQSLGTPVPRQKSCIMLMCKVCCLLSMSIDIHVQCPCCRPNHCMNLKAS